MNGTRASTVAPNAFAIVLEPMAHQWLTWRKIHFGIDEKTFEIRAAEFTTSNVGDAPMLPELLDQIPPDQEIGSVTADGAFDTRKCHDAIAPVALPRSYRPARTHGPGSPTVPVPSRATRPCVHRNASAGPSGEDGAAITAEAASKQRCIVSNCWASDWPRGTLTVRSQSSRSGLPC